MTTRSSSIHTPTLLTIPNHQIQFTHTPCHNTTNQAKNHTTWRSSPQNQIQTPWFQTFYRKRLALTYRLSYCAYCVSTINHHVSWTTRHRNMVYGCHTCDFIWTYMWGRGRNSSSSPKKKTTIQQRAYSVHKSCWVGICVYDNGSRGERIRCSLYPPLLTNIGLFL